MTDGQPREQRFEPPPHHLRARAAPDAQTLRAEKLKIGLVVLACLVGLVSCYVLRLPPAVTAVARDLEVDLQGSRTRYAGTSYGTAWGQTTRQVGLLRYIERAEFADARFITHDAVLASGDFADPAKVEIISRGGGNFLWRARELPQGSLIFLHIVPGSVATAEVLEHLAEGDRVELTGRFESRQAIDGPTGERILALNHDNHRFFLVAEAISPPPVREPAEPDEESGAGD